MGLCQIEGEIEGEDALSVPESPLGRPADSAVIGQEPPKTLPEMPELPLDLLSGTEEVHGGLPVEGVRGSRVKHGDAAPHALKLVRAVHGLRTYVRLHVGASGAIFGEGGEDAKRFVPDDDVK
jgi:hypothetical protein